MLLIVLIARVSKTATTLMHYKLSRSRPNYSKTHHGTTMLFSYTKIMGTPEKTKRHFLSMQLVSSRSIQSVHVQLKIRID